MSFPRIAIPILSLLLTVVQGAAVLSQPRQVIKLATEAAAGSPQVAQLYALAAELEAQTDGAAQTKIFPSGRIGSGTRLLKRVQSGEVQIAALPYDVLSKTVPALAMLSAPHVFRDIAHADRALDRHAAKLLRDLLAEAELRFLTPGESTLKHWFVSGQVPAKPEALVQYAVWSRNSPIEQLEWKLMGLTPLENEQVPTGQPLWFRATAAQARLSGHDRLCDKIIRADDVLSGHLVVMSQRWFDGLPERVQKQIDRLKSQTAEAARKAERELDEVLLARMGDRGVEILPPPKSSRRLFQRSGRAVQQAWGAATGYSAQRLLILLRRR